MAFDGLNMWVALPNVNSRIGGPGGIQVIGGTRFPGNSTDFPSTIPTGGDPRSIVFDGSSLWVANFATMSVSKVALDKVSHAPNGIDLVQNFPVPGRPSQIAFDGTNIWVTLNTTSNPSTGALLKLQRSNGAVLLNIPLPGLPEGLAFDGANIWVARSMANDVQKYRASDGILVATVPLPNGAIPFRVTFDGVYVWVTLKNSKNIAKIRANNPTMVDVYPMNYALRTPQGTYQMVTVPPDAICFDGANIWIAVEPTPVAGALVKR
jgi:sugar lactone lactonase YvrE